MSVPTADAVMAATYELVQQAMSGQWHDMPRTIEERRLLLDRLSASATAQDREWLNALKQAMAESDAVIAKMREEAISQHGTADAADEQRAGVDDVLEMIRGS